MSAPCPTPRPTFSVIVPVYNAGATIDATVASVLAQEDGDFELLLIDDGSTDDGLARMQRIGAADARVRVIAKDNEGVSATRNLGAELARGRLLAFLDADDLWSPDKLARHRLQADLPDAPAIGFAQIAFLEPNQHALEAARTRSTVPAAALTLIEVLSENPACTASNIVVTADCFAATGGFRTGMSYAEDQEWLARAVIAGHAVRGIDALLVGYRLSGGGLSADLGRMYAGWRNVAAEHGDGSDLAAAEALFCRYLARRALRVGGSAIDPLRYAALGIRRNARAFFADRRRGGLTLAGATTGLFLPTALRARLFA